MRTTFTVHHNEHVSSRPFEEIVTASERTAWPNLCGPNDVAVIGIKPIDAALLPKAGECRRQLSATDDCFPSKLACLRDLNCRALGSDRDHSK